MVKIGCLFYLDYVHNTSVASPPHLDCVYVISKFNDVFTLDFSGMPLDCDIDFVRCVARHQYRSYSYLYDEPN